MVAFVARLRPDQSPDQVARQLPDQSTTIRVEPSSTDDSRLQGALPQTEPPQHLLQISHVACFRLSTRLWISSCKSSISHLSRNASYSPSVSAGRGKDFGFGAISQANTR